jgi:Pentapeptide repeats (9 copies)
LSNWIISAGALVVLAVAVVIWFVLLRRYSGQGASVQLDAIRIGGTLVIGTGGAVALLLTARRQRYTELTLVHTDRDATERRITELYTDQLGSDHAPVRLAGLYALERLAHSAVEHRQTIVDVICAYLRMPYTPPPASASVLGRSYRSGRPGRQRRARRLTDWPSHRAPASQGARHEHAYQELQVRLTAQDILLRNLRVVAQRRRRWWYRTLSSAAPAWPRIRLDLTGALLLGFSLSKCQLDSADFTRAEFSDLADFRDAQFTHGADFGFAQFAAANFRGAQFAHGVYFGFAQFDTSSFYSAQFTKGADFAGAQFTNAPYFQGAQVASTDELGAVWPQGWTTRSAKSGDGEDPTFLYLTDR